MRRNSFPYHSFLNKMLVHLETKNYTFLAVTMLGIFSLYLLWCVMKGVFKIGIKIPMFFTIHPMIKDETWMNTFLFNVGLLLLCSVSLC